MHPIIYLPVVGIVLYLLLRLLFRGGNTNTNTNAEASDSEDELIRLCFGNEKQAQRLIDLERKKAPNISRSEAAKRASRSIRRDLK